MYFFTILGSALKRPPVWTGPNHIYPLLRIFYFINMSFVLSSVLKFWYGRQHKWFITCHLCPFRCHSFGMKDNSNNFCFSISHSFCPYIIIRIILICEKSNFLAFQFSLYDPIDDNLQINQFFVSTEKFHFCRLCQLWIPLLSSSRMSNMQIAECNL